MYAHRCFACLWDAFALIAPRAARLRTALAQAGFEAPIEHVGLRTIAAPPIGLRELERHLLAMDYHRCSQARDPARGAGAGCWRGAEAHLPRIGIVELGLGALSEAAHRAVATALEGIAPERVVAADLLWGGRAWPRLRYEDYVLLMREAPHLAWVMAVGLRPSHVALRLDAGLDMDQASAVARDAKIALERRTIAGVELLVSSADALPVELAKGRIHEVPSARVALVDPAHCSSTLGLQLPLALAELAAAPSGGRDGT